MIVGFPCAISSLHSMSAQLRGFKGTANFKLKTTVHSSCFCYITFALYDMSTTQRMQSPPWMGTLRALVSQFKRGTHMHIVEAFVDIVKLPVMSNVLIDLQVTSKVV